MLPTQPGSCSTTEVEVVRSIDCEVVVLSAVVWSAALVQLQRTISRAPVATSFWSPEGTFSCDLISGHRWGGLCALVWLGANSNGSNIWRARRGGVAPGKTLANMTQSLPRGLGRGFGDLSDHNLVLNYDARQIYWRNCSNENWATRDHDLL